MLRDYYKCMLTPMPEEITSEYPRLPLIDVCIKVLNFIIESLISISLF